MPTNYADLKVDESGKNLELTNGDLTILTSNVDSVKQRLAMTFSIWKSEWQFNIDFGFPYWDYLGKKIGKDIVDAKVKQTVRSKKDILRIIDFKSSFENRYYEAYFTVVTKELEEINIAFIGSEQYLYPSPDSETEQLCDTLGPVEYGNKLYNLINFRLPSTGDSTWINLWK